MTLRAPLVDPRDADAIAAQVDALLRHYVDGYAGGEAATALAHAFGLLCSLVVDRLNEAPAKNFLAFLDLLGNSPVPAQPASCPLSFTLADTVADGFMLPAGAQVQADPPAGQSSPIVFETAEDLWLSTLDLVAIATRAAVGAPVDHVGMVGPPGGALPVPLFDALGFALMIGYSLVAPRTPPTGLPVVTYLGIDSPRYDPKPLLDSGVGAMQDPLDLAWSYCAGDLGGGLAWLPLAVDDGTEALTHDGRIAWEMPPGMPLVSLDGAAAARYWIRAVAADRAYVPPPALRWCAQNTVRAVQCVTTGPEILGSSDGSAGQVWRSLRQPVLPGPVLEILERPALELAGVAGGADAATGDQWIEWAEVIDFHASGPQDRQYVMNHQSGEVRFGDGVHGMVPVAGSRNVRLTRYQAGGGTQGNLPAGALQALSAGSRLVAGVANAVAATGGSPVEEPDALLQRAPRNLRHRGRAVTAGDYEDLALLSSTEVARALCVPLCNLAATPLASTDNDSSAGTGLVSLVLVPRSDDPMPQPSYRLLRFVHGFVAARACAGVSLFTVGALYLRTSVTLRVKLASPLDKAPVVGTLKRLIAAFLHPVTGRDGDGWPFGRLPHESDIHRLIWQTPGVVYVASLSLATVSVPGHDQPVLATGRFLVCCGDLDIEALP